MSPSVPVPVIESILARHAEDAAFLWLLRDAAVDAPHYTRGDLADLDRRLEAHLEGLRLAADAGWRRCLEGLGFEESGEVFVAAAVALRGDAPDRLEPVLEVVEQTPETARGLVSALGWVAAERLRGKIAAWLESPSPLRRGLGLAACAAQRVDPGDHLARALRDPDPELRHRALRGVGELGRTDLAPALRADFETEDPIARLWAAWSALLLGDRERAPRLLLAAPPDERPSRVRARLTALRCLAPKDAEGLLGELLRDPGRTPWAIRACGAVGDPFHVPWLLQRMREPEQARAAGEAFSAVTGADLAYLDLDAEPPAGFQAGPDERPEHEDVTPDPDEDLPWPDPVLVAEWWEARRRDFAAGRRYLVGRPLDEIRCVEVLVGGYQRQRHAAALELALLRPGTGVYNVRAPGFRQR